MTISPRVFLAVVLLSVTALAQSNPQSESQKIAETRKAAEQGNAYAQGNLGFAYAKGEGVPQDYAEAGRWFRKGAEHGNAYAQYYLGLLYFIGKGVPQDYIQAHMWANLAAAASTGEGAQKEAANLRDEIADKMTPEQIAEAQRLAREWKPSSAK